ncbi:MAG: hypothetical protein ABSC38_02630, partial [Verrucomicrobiia bacterium]
MALKKLAGEGCYRLARLLLSLSGVMAFLALWSWVIGKWQWLSLGTGHAPMPPATAWLLLLLNTALLAYLRWPTKRAAQWFGRGAGLAAAASGVLAMLRPVFGWRSPLEQWLAGGAGPVGEITPFSKLVFLLFGLAVLFHFQPFRDKRPFRWLGIGLALLVSWISV